jgi:hypothetical protein
LPNAEDEIAVRDAALQNLHRLTTDVIPPRSIKLTAEQEYVIRENIKDVRGGQVAQNVAPKVDEKIPPNVELHGFPSLVIEKVPQVKVLNCSSPRIRLCSYRHRKLLPM